MSLETPAEEAAYGKWLDQTSEREEARRDRLHGAAGIIPASLWLVLFLVAGSRLRVHAVLRRQHRASGVAGDAGGSATAVVVATLLAMYALDHPYQSGIGSIEPVAMERSLGIIEEARGILEQDGPLPCDARGVAR